jgi:hypothetical protein
LMGSEPTSCHRRTKFFISLNGVCRTRVASALPQGKRLYGTRRGPCAMPIGAGR